MQKAKLFLMFGLWIAVLPYLGFPILIKNLLFSVTGLILVYFGLLIRSQIPKKDRSGNKNFDNFSENSWQPSGANEINNSDLASEESSDRYQ